MTILRIALLAALSTSLLVAQGQRWEEVDQANSFDWGALGAPVCWDANVQGFLSTTGATGLFSPGTNDITRVFDPVTKSWSVIPVTNPVEPLIGASMAYDPVRQVSVLFGGIMASGGFALSDTWEFDGTDWTNLSPVFNPEERLEANMSYDPHLGGVILLGGDSLSFQPNDGTVWVWNGIDWLPMAPNGPGPEPRRAASFSYDPVRNVHVLYGGRQVDLPFTYMDDTWELDTTTMTWTQIMTPTSPPGRSGAAMTYDARIGRTVMYGGLTTIVGNPASYRDTWSFDGTNWVEISGPGTDAGRRNLAVMVSDPNTDQVYLFGGLPVPLQPSGHGEANEIWTWRDLSPSAWPGTANDARIDVYVNAQFDEGVGGVHQVDVGQFFLLRLESPLHTRDNARVALFYDLLPSGAAPAGISLIGGDPASVWINPATAVLAFDGLSFPYSPLVPQILPQGTPIGPYAVSPSLAGARAVVQMVVEDPGATPFDFSLTDAVVVDFQ